MWADFLFEFCSTCCNHICAASLIFCKTTFISLVFLYDYLLNHVYKILQQEIRIYIQRVLNFKTYPINNLKFNLFSDNIKSLKKLKVFKYLFLPETHFSEEVKAK